MLLSVSSLPESSSLISLGLFISGDDERDEDGELLGVGIVRAFSHITTFVKSLIDWLILANPGKW